MTAQPCLTASATLIANTTSDNRPQGQALPSVLDIERLPATAPYAPDPEAATFEWGARSGIDIISTLNAIYEEVVHWHGGLFTVPLGGSGKKFAIEAMRLIEAFTEENALEPIALVALMTMPHLLLQDPHPTANHQDRVKCLERRMDLWAEGKFEELLKESRAIRAHRATHNSKGTHSTKEEDETSRLFSEYMRRGKVKAALRLLTCDGKGKVLSLDDLLPDTSGQNKTVREILRDKQPPPGAVEPDALLASTGKESHPVLFDRLDGKCIRRAAINCQGSAGPSGLDALTWQRLCTMYHGTSRQLCNAIARMARRIATTPINPQSLRALVACRLVPLSKNPGVRPIGICESLRRIIGKSIMKIIGNEVQAVVGADQLCARQKAGCETAVHTMSDLFGSHVEGVLFVDAKNAFNNINRSVFLHNIRTLCPSFATCVENYYRGEPELFVDGETIFSREGTTQGDPLSMAIYALATLPLIQKTKLPGVTQDWFADDSSAGADIDRLYSWWCTLTDEGPKYGYFVNPPKTCLVVKPDKFDAATEKFKHTGVRITTEGKALLGAPIGSKNYVTDSIKADVARWCDELEKLARFAQSQPHAAFAAMTHGQANKWIYLARVNAECSRHFGPLEEKIRLKLLPALCGRSVNDTDREIFCLPLRLGGLGIENPVADALTIYQEARKVTAPLVNLQHDASSSVSTAFALQHQASIVVKVARRKIDTEQASSLLNSLPQNSPASLALRWSQQSGASTWLSALPLKAYGFNLTKREFHDAMCLRYGWTPANLPSTCVCGQQYNVEHALSCMRGGFISLRHNEVRDVLADLFSSVCHNVCTEPELQPVAASENSAPARLDIKASGFWGGSRYETAFFDVRVFNPYAASYRNLAPEAIFKSHEKQKCRLYNQRVKDVEGGSFTPLVFSCNGLPSKSSTIVLKRLGSMISEKRDLNYSETMCLIRCKLSFALLKSCILCIRGARSRHENSTNKIQDMDPAAAVAEARLNLA